MKIFFLKKMFTLFHFFLVCVGIVPAAVSTLLFAYFYANDLILWTMYPTVLCGFFPLVWACDVAFFSRSPVSTLLRKVRSQSKINRFMVGVATWLLISTSSFLISVAARLTMVSDYATICVFSLVYAIMFAICAQISAFQVSKSELAIFPIVAGKYVKDTSIFGEEIDEVLEEKGEEEGKEEGSNIQLRPILRGDEEKAVRNSMKSAILRNRRQSFGPSRYCLLLSFICVILGVYTYSSSIETEYDIYKGPTFTVPCINQTIVNDFFQTKRVFGLSTSSCTYPLCSRLFSYSYGEQNLYSIVPSSPAIPLEFVARGSKHVEFNDRSIASPAILPPGCMDYKILQTCDGLGYVGIVGRIKVGANCTCSPPSSDNGVCTKKETAPKGFPFSNLVWPFLLFILWQIATFQQQNEFKFDMLVKSLHADKESSSSSSLPSSSPSF